MIKTWTLITLLGLVSAVYGAEMYRWVDEKGVVNYTPYPPPAKIRKVEPKNLGDNTVQTTPEMPYSLQLAVKNFPVTLYATASCGDPCKVARAYLNKRGVPFTEKNPGAPEELENFKKIAGEGMEVPLLVVGKLKTLSGYLASEWDAALDLAGYPSTAVPGAAPAPAPPAAAK